MSIYYSILCVYHIARCIVVYAYDTTIHEPFMLLPEISCVHGTEGRNRIYIHFLSVP